MERPFYIICAFSSIYFFNEFGISVCPTHFHIYLSPQSLTLEYIFSGSSQMLSPIKERHTKKNSFLKDVLNSIYIMNSRSTFLREYRIYPTQLNTSPC